MVQLHGSSFSNAYTFTRKIYRIVRRVLFSNRFSSMFQRGSLWSSNEDWRNRDTGKWFRFITVPYFFFLVIVGYFTRRSSNDFGKLSVPPFLNLHPYTLHSNELRNLQVAGLVWTTPALIRNVNIYTSSCQWRGIFVFSGNIPILYGGALQARYVILPSADIFRAPFQATFSSMVLEMISALRTERNIRL